ncbi:MAG: RAMP superfamily CRISPR-associated protein [Thermoanaerobaculia bacterium]
MSRHGISRPEGGVLRSAAVPHDRWFPDRLTGAIELSLETLQDRFVSPGTGRLILSGSEGHEVVAEKAARSQDHPVVPGSGIKGAVRTLYELLSFSCNPFDFISGCKGLKLCDACSLFGARGHLGRVSFSDAVPYDDNSSSVHIIVRNLPIGHESHGSKTQGEFRFYDLAPDASSGKGEAPRQTHAREVFTGKFRARLAFTNANPEEIGRLLLTLGLGKGEEITGFPLRLGGVKYDGQGAMRIAAESLTVRAPRRESLKGDACRERLETWITEALGSSWGTSFRSTYDEISSLLRSGGGAR